MTAVMSDSPPTTQTHAALAQLIADHQATVWRYLRFLGASATDADDLTQETFLAVARSGFVQHSTEQTVGYLRTVARNQLLMLRRRQNREVRTVALEAADNVWSETLSKAGGIDAWHAALADCLETITGRARTAIDGFYRDRQSRQELAQQLEMQADGVKTLLRRTRDALRKCIERKMNAE